MYNVMYMGAQRTQIYLTAEQRARIDAECVRTGVSLAEVIRIAVDEYLAARDDDEYREVLRRTFGAIPDMPYPDRSDWDRGYG